MTNTPYAWLGSFELVEALETPVYHTANFAVWASNRKEIEKVLAELQFEKPWGIHRVVSVMPASQWPTSNTETDKLTKGVNPTCDFKLGGTYPLPTPSIDNDTEYLTITEHKIPPLPEQKNVPFWEKEWITPELKALLFDQPDAEQPLNTYLVVDATLRKDITGFFDLDNIDVPVKCLFTGDAAEELKEVAPYLIDLTLSDESLNNKDKIPEFHRDFFENHWDQSTGIAIRTTASMTELHHHLRKFTKIQDEQGKWYFLRFWDPRTLQMAIDLHQSSQATIIIALCAPGLIHYIFAPIDDLVWQISPTEERLFYTEKPQFHKDIQLFAKRREYMFFKKIEATLALEHPALQELADKQTIEDLCQQAQRSGYSTEIAIWNYVRICLSLRVLQDTTPSINTTLASIEVAADPHQEYNPTKRSQRMWEWCTQHMQKETS